MIPPFGPQHRMVGPGDPAVFAFRFDSPARYGMRAVRVHPNDTRILIGSTGLDVRFGSYRVRTASANVTGAWHSESSRWWRSIGARYFADERRLVLSGSRYGAVDLTFDRPVLCTHRRRQVRLTAVTVTLTEPDEFVATVRAFAPSCGGGTRPGQGPPFTYEGRP